VGSAREVAFAFPALLHVSPSLLCLNQQPHVPDDFVETLAVILPITAIQSYLNSTWFSICAPASGVTTVEPGV
jgi:hypothetical protein